MIGDDDDETITGTTRGDFLLGNGGVDLFLYSSGALLGPLDTIDGGDGLDGIRFTSTTAGDKLVLSPLITSVEIIQISNGDRRQRRHHGAQPRRLRAWLRVSACLAMPVPTPLPARAARTSSMASPGADTIVGGLGA